MRLINYNLRSVSTGKTTTIMLLFRYAGCRIRMSFKEKILVEAWDKKEQRIKPSYIPEYKHINLKLDAFSSYLENLLQQAEKNGIVLASSAIKKQISTHLKTNRLNDLELDFWELLTRFIGYKKKFTSSSHEYETLSKHLHTLEHKLGIVVTFEALRYSANGFIDHWNDYLVHEAPNKQREPGLAANTIWKLFKNLRAFLNWCFDQNYVAKFSTKHLTFRHEQISHVYLTSEELTQLEGLLLFDEERIVRDLFLISCETGLRFSDLCNLQLQHGFSDQFVIHPKKTRKTDVSRKIIIPFSARVKRILGNYSAGIPSYSYARIGIYNKILRPLCARASINSTCVQYRIVQGKEHVVSYKKHELISSHSGRRTFCTLKFLAGMPVHVIMKFSGHSSEQNFLRYLKLDAEITAEKYRDFF